MSKKKDKKIVSADGSKGIVSKRIKDKKKKEGKTPRVTVKMLDTSRGNAVSDLMHKWGMFISEPNFIGSGDENVIHARGGFSHPTNDDVILASILGLETKGQVAKHIEAEFRMFYATQYSGAKLSFILRTIDNHIDDNLLLDFKYNKPKAIAKVRAIVNSIGGLND